jgi:hypothetical protein
MAFQGRTQEQERLPKLDEVFDPREQLGKSRCDCLPHRASTLRALAQASLILAALSLLPCMPMFLMGLPLGLCALCMARRDLMHISAGAMDRDGFHQTLAALSEIRTAVFANVVCLLLWLGGLICLVTRL